MLRLAEGAGGLDYDQYRLGGSKIDLRGPWRSPKGDGVIALGGLITYGRFIEHPWPKLLEDMTSLQVINLGVPQAGPDAYLRDPEVISLARMGAVRVVEVTGACNISNSLWSVHPRRNDRVVHVQPMLRQLYPEVDFMNVVFTGHMLSTLATKEVERFAQVVRILQEAWMTRMVSLLEAIGPPVVLLVLRDHEGRLPPLLDHRLLAALADHAAGVVSLDLPREDRLIGKVFGEVERFAAEHLPGPISHELIAEELCEALTQI